MDLADFFEQEEQRLLAEARAEIAADKLRFESDPVYRAHVEAKRAATMAALERSGALLDAVDDDQADDDEDDEE